MKINKNQITKAMPTVLFVTGIVGIFVSDVLSVTGTLKAEKILREERTVLKPGEDPNKVTPFYKEENKDEMRKSQVIVACDTKREYYIELFKATWKAYIPCAISTTLTVTALIVSKHLTKKQIIALSTAVASAGSLVTKYRDKIKEVVSEDVLHDIDREVAKDTICQAMPPVIATPGILRQGEAFDLSSDDPEVEFYDPFTKMKFTSTKLAVLGAKYYLNRNYAIGGSVPLSMFYEFLGLELPDEYKFAGWDVNAMSDQGFYWIDIDIVKSVDVDQQTGKKYYILEYDFLPGDSEDNYYPFGNPLQLEGSYAI